MEYINLKKKHSKTVIVLVVSLILVGIINIILFIDQPTKYYFLYSIVLSIYFFSAIPSIIIGYKYISILLLESVTTLGLFLGILFVLMMSIILAPYGMLKYYFNKFKSI